MDGRTTTSRPGAREIVERVNCTFCKQFLGFIYGDGSGPKFGPEDCPTKADPVTCPMVAALAKYRPRYRPLWPLGKPSVGNPHPGYDEDAGSLEANARMALEGD